MTLGLFGDPFAILLALFYLEDFFFNVINVCAHVITIAIVILTVDYCDRSELDHPEGCFKYFGVLTERDERDKI